MNKLLVFILLLSSFLFANEGKEIYEKKCASCHQLYIPTLKLKENFMEQNNTLLNLKAPTINQIAFRLQSRIGDPRGDKDMHQMEVGAFLSDYLINPDKQKSICLPEVIKHFETMPSMKGLLDDDEMEAISEFLYEYDAKEYRELEVKYLSYKEAIKLSKDKNKTIMIELMREHCFFCKQMEEEVFSEKEIIKKLNSDFISVLIDVDKVKKLPLGLKSGVTPSFVFVEDGKIVAHIHGAWNKKDFLEILNGDRK
ncbi:MAG: DUF255 domain-containing protein [Sulfurovaceae bacterium]|nr:DUF255 domain-containing protein [Sulfurovaceae bacterium]